MKKEETDKKNFGDNDFFFIGVLSVVIAYLTSRLIIVTIKEMIVLSLDATLLIELVIYFGIIAFILKYYYTKKYEGVP
ncbi:hypothetical protein KAU33_16045 [Candidatus Dependentiae bacterium]|nr:hypothetical protein [Candidatus Dependentiae bacterium]